MGLSDCIDCWDTPCQCTDKLESPKFWSNKIKRILDTIADGSLMDEERLDQIEAICHETPAPQCSDCTSTRNEVGDDGLCARCRKRKRELHERLGLTRS